MELLISSHVLSRHLFAFGFPVRGAITCGEAEAIDGTNHFIGKAIIRAAMIEKSQEWFGVVLDPDFILPEHEAIMGLPLFQTVTLKYPAPFKIDAPFSGEQFVLNWRFNLAVQNGIRSVFPESSRPSDQTKLENTLKFCQHIVSASKAYGKPQDANGRDLVVPWLNRIFSGSLPPGSKPGPYAPDDGY